MLQKLICLLKQTGALSLLALGALLATLFNAWVYHSQLQTQNAALQAEYGQSLANMAAEQAIDGAISQDLVSLQVMLSNIISNPRAVAATIHDVENLLLVQAGSPPPPPFSESAYSAPITVDDEVAGVVTVFIETNTAGSPQFWYLCFALSALGALVVFGLHWQPRWSIDTINVDEVKTGASPIEPAPIPSPELPPKAPVLLSISCNNLTQLNQQLNSDARAHLLEVLYNNLDKICHLYSGELKTLEDGRLLLAFVDEENDDAVFRAICSAQLLLALNQQCDGLRLKLCTRISQAKEISPLQQLQQTLTGQDELLASRHYPLLIQDDLLLDAMQEQMRWESSDILGQAEITAIMQPYQKLLENQLSQLNLSNAETSPEEAS